MYAYHTAWVTLALCLVSLRQACQRSSRCTIIVEDPCFIYFVKTLKTPFFCCPSHFKLTQEMLCKQEVAESCVCLCPYVDIALVPDAVPYTDSASLESALVSALIPIERTPTCLQTLEASDICFHLPLIPLHSSVSIKLVPYKVMSSFC